MRDDFEFFWHGDRGYANCEYGQWYMRDMKIDLTEMVNHLPFLQDWIDAGRHRHFGQCR